MKISDFAIAKPLVTVVAMLLLVVGGVLALSQLETDEYPDVRAPVVLVGVSYPGAAPTQVERDMLRPIEQKLRTLGGINRVTGTATDGYAQVVAEFSFTKEVGEAAQDVREAVSAVRGALPPEVREPVVERYSETDTPVQSIVLSSRSESPAALGVRARELARQLRTVSGVAAVAVLGDETPQLSVRVRSDALRANGVTLLDVTQALESQNIATPVGRLDSPDLERSLRFDGRPRTPQEFAALTVSARDDHVVRLGDVADVLVGSAEQRTASVLNGEGAVGLDVRKARNASTTSVARAVRNAVAASSRQLPTGTTLTIVQDAGERVERAVWDVQKTLLEGAALTVLVVFLFLNSWRSTVVTGLALPVSVLASFMAVWAFGFRLETMSLMGLSLAIGILIDDAIVVRENIVRHVHMGKDHVTAAREGTKEIGLAVTATTLAIVAVFTPVGFMSGIAGQYFKPFALTVAASVLASLFVSFSLDPMLSAYWPDPPVDASKKTWISRQLDHFNLWFDGLATSYRTVIDWALHHRAATIALTIVLLAVSIVLPMSGLVGSDFIPKDDQSVMTLTVETPAGSSLPYTLRKSEEAAAMARAIPDVRSSYLTVGGADGAVTTGTVTVNLLRRQDRTRDVYAVLAELRARTARIAGATVSLSAASGPGSGAVKDIAVEVRGQDAAVALAAATALTDSVRLVPGATDVGLSVKTGQPQISIVLQRTLASTLGLSPALVAQTLRAAYAGVEAGDWVDANGDTRKVVVRLIAEDRSDLSSLSRLPLMIASATGVPVGVALEQIAQLKSEHTAAQINHLDGEPVVTIGANVNGQPLGDVTDGIAAMLARQTLPQGIRVTLGGSSKQQAEVFGGILAALGAAMLCMYFILVLQFGSFLEPLAILLSLPLSMIGVVLALLLTGNTINIMSMIGVVLLAGVAAKNAILLLEFAKQMHEDQGMPLRDALREAGAIRLRPILMTTIALVAGMIPTALGTGEGAQFRAPLGVAVIGGTISSTVLTLLVVPTVYETLMAMRGRVWKSQKIGAPATPVSLSSVANVRRAT